MKKLVFILGIFLANLTVFGQHNEYKYPIYANGGIRVGENGDQWDSTKIMNGGLTFFLHNGNIKSMGNMIDPAVFGFDPSVSASTNRAALQQALDSTGIVTISKPGVYEMDSMIYVRSNTLFLCSPGVVLKRSKNYGAVLSNYGNYSGSQDSNIVVMNLTIDCNDYDGSLQSVRYGMRGNIEMYHIKNSEFRNIQILNEGSGAYGFNMSRWENVHINGLIVTGHKDGLDIGPGHNGLFENLTFDTYDDAMYLYISGNYTNCAWMDSIYNIVYRNVHDIPYPTKPSGYILRLTTASWADWASGNTYQPGNLCTNAGHLYIITNLSGTFTASDAPTHTSGIVTGSDGISWRYVNDYSMKYANINNITIENANVYDNSRLGLVTYGFLSSADAHNVYPGTETLSEVDDLRILNCSAANVGFLCESSGNLKNVYVNGNDLDSVAKIFNFPYYFDSSNVKVNIVFEGNFIHEGTAALLYNQKDGQKIDIFCSNNLVDSDINYLAIYSNSIYTDSIRVTTENIPIHESNLSDYAVNVNNSDIVRTENGLKQRYGNDFYLYPILIGKQYNPDPGFDDPTNWHPATGWSVSGGKASCDGSQTANSYIYYPCDTIYAGYETLNVITISNYSAGTLHFYDNATQFSGNGMHIVRCQYSGATIENNIIYADADFVGDIDEWRQYLIIKK